MSGSSLAHNAEHGTGRLAKQRQCISARIKACFKSFILYASPLKVDAKAFAFLCDWPRRPATSEQIRLGKFLGTPSGLFGALQSSMTRSLIMVCIFPPLLW